MSEKAEKVASGMKIDFRDLVGQGVFRKASIPKEYAHIDAEYYPFLIDLFIAGEKGITRSTVNRRINRESIDILEMAQLVKWERDNRGNLAYLVVSWKGQEFAQALIQVARDRSVVDLQEKLRN
jgi:hypothetical protein